MNKQKKMRLPYMNNASTILITLGINLAILIVVGWGKTFRLEDILIDAAICGVLTSVIDVFLVRRYVNKAKKNKTLPVNVPVSKWMMKLPQNSALFAGCCGIFFGILTPLLNGLIFIFYGFEALSFGQMLVLKLLYACFLSAKILEVAIFRLIQPDLTGHTADPQAPPSALVKQPIPHISYFQQLYNSWLTDFGMNMALGLALGGTIITPDNYILIAPTLLSGVAISGPISGIIVTYMTIPAVAKGIRHSVGQGEIPRQEKRNPWIAWLPESPWALATALCLPVVLVTTVVYMVVLSFFDFQSLDFFQFFFIRTAYTAVLVKGLVPLILLRYRQPQQA